MNKTPALVLTAALALVGCAGDGAVVTAEQPQAAAAAPAVPPPSIGALPADLGQTWQVRRVTCRQWLGTPEPERHSETMLYYGWLVGRQKIEAIDTGRMAAELRLVMDRCARAPDLTVADAFQGTLTTPARWIWQQP